ncbi:MAG: DUF2225 domain-containing protein [Calditrichia bacterium]|nr:DUF2225 domain-containing protein [Calditrichia bacterium]
MNLKNKLEIKKESLPYFEKEITCPICSQKYIHNYLRERVYIVQKKENDQYPKEIEWYNARHKKFNHLYFFILYCPNCHFADERTAFLNPYKYYDAQKFNMIRTIHKERCDIDPFIKLMSNYIDYPDVNYTSAINIHMLAIYAQFGPTSDQYYEHEKIARFFHRIAWLFRENIFEGQYTDKEAVINEFTILHDSYQTAFLNCLSSFENIKEWWNQEIEAEDNGEKEKALSNFQMEIKMTEKEISRLLDHLLLNNPKIYEIITRYREKFIKTNSLIVEQQYHDFTSYHAFLQQVKKEWILAPTDEIIAMHKAAEHYYLLSKSTAYAGEMIKQHNIYKLMIAIYNKLNEYRKELKIINLAFKTATDYRKKAINRMNILSEQGEATKHMVDHIKRTVRKIDDMVMQLNYQRKKIIKGLIKKDEEKAQKIIDNFPENMPPEKKIEKLEEANLLDEVIESYREEFKPKTIFNKLFH